MYLKGNMGLIHWLPNSSVSVANEERETPTNNLPQFRRGNYTARRGVAGFSVTSVSALRGEHFNLLSFILNDGCAPANSFKLIRRVVGILSLA